MTTMKLNNDQRLYVLRHEQDNEVFFSCWGFDVLFNLTSKLANWLGVEPPEEKMRGTEELYNRYEFLSQVAEQVTRETGRKCDICLTKKLIGYEGKRVEITRIDGSVERFKVGISTGWMPVHLAIEGRKKYGSPAPSDEEIVSVRPV